MILQKSQYKSVMKMRKLSRTMYTRSFCIHLGKDLRRKEFDICSQKHNWKCYWVCHEIHSSFNPNQFLSLLLLLFYCVFKMDHSIFVGEVPEDFNCPICMLVVNEPVEHSKCRKFFCRECLLDARLGQKCPQCRHSLVDTIINMHPFVRDQYEKLRIRCEHGGCPEIFPLSSKTRHITNCGFRPVVCAHCRQSIPQKDMDSHHRDVCTMYPVACPVDGCQAIIPRSKMDDHHRNFGNQHVEIFIRARSALQRGQRELTDVIQQRDQLQNQLHVAVQRSVTLQNQLYEAMQRSDEQENQLDEAIQQRDRLYKQLYEATQQRDALQNQLDETIQQRDQLGNQRHEANQRRVELLNQLYEAIQQKAEQENQLDEAIQQRVGLYKQMYEAIGQIDRLDETIQQRDALENNLNEAIQQRDALGYHLEEVMVQHNRQMEVLQQDRDELSRKLRCYSSAHASTSKGNSDEV